MPEDKPFVLLVEDSVLQRTVLSGFLEKCGYEVGVATGSQEALSLSSRRRVDLLLTDLRLDGPDGIDVLNRIKEHQKDLQAIVLTAYGTTDDAVRAMKAGAYDFVSKPVDLTRLEVLVEKALEKAALSAENRVLTSLLQGRSEFDELIGGSPAMQKLKETAVRVAGSRSAVLILGESGTGKEVLARSIHRLSQRRNQPFISVNCASLPDTLIESELFGHEAGAFTGALREKKGRFELARGGTLFLDEIGEVPPHVQVKLLSVLQSGRFERVGGTVTLNTDARIIAATNRDLDRAIEEGVFRSDLYYRLNVVSLILPPLRERPADIPELVRHFLNRQSDLCGHGKFSVTSEVMAAMLSYPFPGNVRELENWLERAAVLADSEILGFDDFPPGLSAGCGVCSSEKVVATETPPSEGGLEAKVQELEVRLIREALAKHRGNQSAAARDLQLTERNIRYKMKKYGL